MSRLLQHLLEKVKAEAIPVLAVKVVTTITSSSSNEVARSRGDELGDLHLAIAAATAVVFDIFEHRRRRRLIGEEEIVIDSLLGGDSISQRVLLVDDRRQWPTTTTQITLI